MVWRESVVTLCHDGAPFVTVNTLDPVLSRRRVTSPFIRGNSTSEEGRTQKMLINEGHF